MNSSLRAELSVWILAVAALICAGVVGLRAPILSDEVFSLDTAALSLDKMTDALRADVHPPLYYFLLHIWMKAAPAGEAGLRLFSLLCAVLALAQFGSLMRRVQVPPGTATALLAANPLVLVMTSYGRMYTLLLLICIITLDQAIRVLHEDSRFRHLLGLAAAVTAGLLTHNWFIFFLCGLAIWVVLDRGRTGFRLLSPAVVGIATYAVLWGPTLVAQVTGRGQHLAWLKPPPLVALAEAMVAQLWLPALVLPVWLIAIALKKWTPVPHNAAWAGALACILVPWIVSQWKPLYNVRFTIIAAPFVAWALVPAAARARAFSGALILLSVGWSLREAASPPACSSESAAQILRAEARPGDTVIFCRLTRKPVEWYWPDSAIQRSSFPAAIDTHPGYEGRLAQDELESQARGVSEHATGRVFVLADSRAMPSVELLRVLKAARGEPAAPRLACSDSSKHYFDRLLVFDAAPKTAESRSGAPRE